MTRRNWHESPRTPPALDCLEDGHLFLDWQRTGVFNVRQKIDPMPAQPSGIRVAWCLWCGTGVSDPDIDTETHPT